MPATDAHSDAALFGQDPLPRIVDVQPLLRGEHADRAAVRVYRRSEDGRTVTSEVDPFYPFFFLSDIELLRGLPRERFRFQRLDGDNFYRHVVAFRSWGDYWDGVRHVERTSSSGEQQPVELYRIGSPVQQYLTQTGRTCFKGMSFDELHRLQLDIEVYSPEGFPNGARAEHEVIIVALHDNRGWHRILHARDRSEAELLRELVDVLRERDPDVIEGHNVFLFDFDYLRQRYERHGIPFAIGRDGSEPRTFPSSMRFAERSIDFTALEIAGRHVVDTYFQVMAFDVFKRDLPGYGLKAAARYFGFAPEGRTYVEGSEIARVWRQDPDRLIDYALDDVIETERLARHLSGSTFYLTPMLPMTYGQVARTGPAAKIEALFVREYLRRKHAFPRSEWGSQAMGGYTDIFLTGVAGPVVYADVESLYPSIMLNYDVEPEGDDLHLFPSLLQRLTDLRLEAKSQMRAAEGEVRGELDARQSSYKVLINCFDPETEVMTLDGPKNVRDVAVGDLVYSLNPDTMQAEIKPVTHVHTQLRYTGKMVQLQNQHVDFLVTPNHRLLTARTSGDSAGTFEWETAADLIEDMGARVLPPLSGLPDRDLWNDVRKVNGHTFLGKAQPPRSRPLSPGGRETERRGVVVQHGMQTLDLPPHPHAVPLPSRATVYARLHPVARRRAHPTGTSSGALPCDAVLGEFLLPKRRYQFGRRRGQEPPTSASRSGSYGARIVGFDWCVHGSPSKERRFLSVRPARLTRADMQPSAVPVLPEHARQVDYDGSIHCITVADNHTVLAGRNGKFNWIGQSFYGSLGFSLSVFNDFSEADRVASTGQQILRQIIELIRERGGKVIEVDTDGVLFVPPDGVRGEKAERAFLDLLNEEMPEGIRIGFDGRFAKMLSYKKKNYALLTYDGTMKFKGSSLISRSNERFGRRFVRRAIGHLLEQDVQALHDLYLRTREEIETHRWKNGVDSFSRTETLKDNPEQYLADVEAGRRPRAASYELAIARGRTRRQAPRKGDRISYYVTGSSANVTAFENSRLTDEWNPDAPDENTAYYIKRLDEFARKFEPFFSEHDFRLVFSPEDLFGFSTEGIELVTHEFAIEENEEEVPF